MHRTENPTNHAQINRGLFCSHDNVLLSGKLVADLGSAV